MDRQADPVAAFEVALEDLPAGVLIMDAAGRIVVVNRELERQFGYGRGELIGQYPEVLVPEGLRIGHVAPREEYLAAPEARPTAAGRQLAGRRKDGTEIAIEVGLRSLQTPQGRFVLASVVDVTVRQAQDLARRGALEEQLRLERFIGELSSQFINVPSGQIHETIREGLRQACDILGLDRATCTMLSSDGRVLKPVSWQAVGILPIDATVLVREQFPWTIARIMSGDAVSFETLDQIPSDIDRSSFESQSVRSAVVMPLSVDGHVTGAVGFCAVRLPRTWLPPVVDHLKTIASVFAQVVARQHRDDALHAAMEEVQRLKNQLQIENVYLRQEAGSRLGSGQIVGQSAALRQVLGQIQQVAATDSTVLLLGETGTGKELFATHVHALGARHSRPMVRVNCAAIPATLIESELFGREKGAFTGALSRQVGRFELADHSTIFLDEIGDLPLDVQVKLLRILEERKFERLGSPRSISVDVRIIAATHRNLDQRVAEGQFREDLYYRLNVFPIHVPPLRERVEDIPLLVWMLVEEFSRTLGKRIDVIDRETLAELQRYSWPGNVRELRNVVERAMIVATDRRLVVTLPQTAAVAVSKRSPKLIDVEKEHIRAVLESTAWRIRGAGGAADRLGMKPTTLETRMAKLGLRRAHS